MRTVVITTGGLGTRLLTYTKVNPKTMLPIYEKSNDRNPNPVVRPLIEYIFENLYDNGFRKFCFIVGAKTKSSIICHLNPDKKYVQLLKKRNLPEDKRFIRTLSQLEKKVNSCDISWISQATPMGFGHALLSASKFVGSDKFLLHAGDVYFPSYGFMSQFVNRHNMTKNVSSTLLLQYKKSLKGYGIAQVRRDNGENIVFHVEEKPQKPLSNLVILPLYIFEPIIFNALRNTTRGHNGELQVTDAIKTLIDWKKRIIGFDYGHKTWFDIGSPQNYFLALAYSFKKSIRREKYSMVG